YVLFLVGLLHLQKAFFIKILGKKVVGVGVNVLDYNDRKKKFGRQRGQYRPERLHPPCGGADNNSFIFQLLSSSHLVPFRYIFSFSATTSKSPAEDDNFRLSLRPRQR